MDRQLVRRHRWLIVVAVVTVGLAAAGFWVLTVAGMRTPDAALDAAVAQYEQNTGLTHVEVEVSVGWSDCAVVELVDHVADDGASVVLLRERGAWRIARTSGPDVGFDSDDLVGEHQACLDLAHSTGPIINGGPADQD